MTKTRTTTLPCKECGYESSKWMGQCSTCKAWNSVAEELISKPSGSQDGLGCLTSEGRKSPVPTARPSFLPETDMEEQNRISTGFGESDRALGNRVVADSLMLMGGDSGIRRSAFLLQVCRNLAGTGQQVLYISGEEPLRQIKMRANHIGSVIEELKLLCETSPEYIERATDTENPQIAVIDSIQAMYGGGYSLLPGASAR